MPQTLSSVEDFDDFTRSNPLAAVYFSGPDCGVCNVLKPKLLQLLADRFPAVAVAEVDCSLHRDVAAQQGVFAVPTLIIFFEGREGMRKARAFSPAEVEAELERPYSIFSDA